MNPFSRHLFLSIICVCITASPLPSGGASFLEDFVSQTPILPKDEVRALWVVRDALNSKEDVDRAIDFAIRARFHLLFVQVRGRGDAFYRSQIEPAAASLELPLDRFDPLAYLIYRAHGAGMAVHAWVNVFYVWSDGAADPPGDHIVRRHPEWLIADRHGTRMDEQPVDAWKSRGIEGYYVAPSNPAARRHTAAVVEDLVGSYAIDGIHLDYIRYPGPHYEDTAGRAAFALRYGVDPLSLVDGGGHTGELPEADNRLLDSLRVEWRTSHVDSMVLALRQAAAHLPLSAAVVPDPEQARTGKGQDWVRWVQRGYVDFVVPMAYRHDPDELIRYFRVLRNTVGAGKFLLGLAVFDDRARYLGESISLLRQEGAAGFSLFSYNALAERRFALRFLTTALFDEYEQEDQQEYEQEHQQD